MSQTLWNGGYGGDTASAWLLVLAAWIFICLRMGVSQCVLLTRAQLLLVSPAYLHLSYDFSGLFYTQMYSHLPCHFFCMSGSCRSDHGRHQSCSRLWSTYISSCSRVWSKYGCTSSSHFSTLLAHSLLLALHTVPHRAVAQSKLCWALWSNAS